MLASWRAALATLLAAGLLWPGVAGAQTPRSTAPPISIELRPTASRLVAGGGLGIVGIIRNVSDGPLYLRESDLSLSLPLELEGRRGEMFSYEAFFPTEHTESKNNGRRDNIIVIGPGQTYTTLWTPGTQTNVGPLGQSWSQLQFVFFWPGDYEVVAAAKYWTTATREEQTGAYQLDAHVYGTSMHTATMPIAVPVPVLLLGAAIGGLLAYAIREIRRWSGRIHPARSRLAAIGGVALSATGALLLSTTGTILLSKMAASQFPVTVNVNDFWTAIGVGCAVQWSGVKILDRLMPADGAFTPRKKTPAPSPAPDVEAT